jgi:rRNA maturation endonuclease Nob1
MQTKAKICCTPETTRTAMPKGAFVAETNKDKDKEKGCKTWFESDKPVTQCPNCGATVYNHNYEAWYNTALTDE